MNTMSCEKHLGMGTVQNCAPCLQVELDYVRSEIARLRKLVVWCLNNGSDFTDQPAEFTWWDGKADALRVIPTDGTDADLIRAALEAMGGVR